MCGRPPSRAPKVRARRKVPADTWEGAPQVEFGSFRSRCFALEGVAGEITQRAKRDRTGSNSEKPEEDGASSETRAQRHSEQPGCGAHALPSPGRVLPHLRVPCDSAWPSRAARSSGTSAPSDDQPWAQCETRQWRQKFAEPVLSSVFPTSRARSKPQHNLPVKAEPGGRCSGASGECRRRSGISERAAFPARKQNPSQPRTPQAAAGPRTLRGAVARQLPGALGGWRASEKTAHARPQLGSATK